MADVTTNAFMLSSATIMLGQALVDDVFSLRPDKHSVGMVSTVNISLDSSVNELLNGTAQSIVDGRRTGISTSISANIFEMTANNFLRAQGMVTKDSVVRRGRLVFDAAGGATSVSFISNPIPGAGESLIASTADLPVGTTILLQRADEKDYVYPAVTTGAATAAGPVFTAPVALPAHMSFASGAQVWIVDPVPVGDIDADALFCAKIVGTMSNFDRPVMYLAPKVRMVKGFSIGFTETQYSSMAWELKAMLLSRGEMASQPRLREIGVRRTGMLMVGAGRGVGSTPPIIVPPTPDPQFVNNGSISPTSGLSTTTFTATRATVANGTVTGHRWLLNGTLIGVGPTVTPGGTAAGELRLQTVATGNGKTIDILSPIVMVSAPPVVVPPTQQNTRGTSNRVAGDIDGLLAEFNAIDSRLTALGRV